MKIYPSSTYVYFEPGTMINQVILNICQCLTWSKASANIICEQCSKLLTFTVEHIASSIFNSVIFNFQMKEFK
jgi:hypothetical protein